MFFSSSEWDVQLGNSQRHHAAAYNADKGKIGISWSRLGRDESYRTYIADIVTTIGKAAVWQMTCG